MLNFFIVLVTLDMSILSADVNQKSLPERTDIDMVELAEHCPPRPMI